MEESFGGNQILTYPDPRLLVKCGVTSNKEAKDIIALLEETLSGGNGEYLGLGLASNQIGIPKRVCIIRYKGAKMNLVNPIISPTSRSSCRIVNDLEGCLSFPGKEVMVPRYNQILVRADNFQGEIHMHDPLFARIIQHEVEHLDSRGIWSHIVIGRNDPCPCGSGKKYRKCCGVNR